MLDDFAQLQANGSALSMLKVAWLKVMMLGRSGVFNVFSTYNIFNLQRAYREVTSSEVKEELYLNFQKFQF